MNHIISSGLDIGEWETKEITDINYLYNEINNKINFGYKMYNMGQNLETFILFMRSTRLFELVQNHKHLVSQNYVYLKLKKDVMQIISIMELIKPELVKKYEKSISNHASFPSVPKSVVSTPKIFMINGKEMDELNFELERRWKKFNNTIQESRKISSLQPILPITNYSHIDNKTNNDIATNFNYLDKSGNPLDSLEILKQNLVLKKLKIVDVPADNNCQFHAIIHQFNKIGIKGWTDSKLRKVAVQWLKKNSDRPMDDGKIGERTLLKDAIGTNDWNDYIKTMSKHGKTWGDEATLLAIAVLFKLEIVVISSLPNNYSHVIKPPVFWNIETTNKINLCHYHEFHYVSTADI